VVQSILLGVCENEYKKMSATSDNQIDADTTERNEGTQRLSFEEWKQRQDSEVELGEEDEEDDRHADEEGGNQQESDGPQQDERHESEREEVGSMYASRQTLNGHLPRRQGSTKEAKVKDEKTTSTARKRKQRRRPKSAGVLPVGRSQRWGEERVEMGGLGNNFCARALTLTLVEPPARNSSRKEYGRKVVRNGRAISSSSSSSSSRSSKVARNVCGQKEWTPYNFHGREKTNASNRKAVAGGQHRPNNQKSVGVDEEIIAQEMAAVTRAAVTKQREVWAEVSTQQAASRTAGIKERIRQEMLLVRREIEERVRKVVEDEVRKGKEDSGAKGGKGDSFPSKREHAVIDEDEEAHSDEGQLKDEASMRKTEQPNTQEQASAKSAVELTEGLEDKPLEDKSYAEAVVATAEAAAIEGPASEEALSITRGTCLLSLSELPKSPTQGDFRNEGTSSQILVGKREHAVPPLTRKNTEILLLELERQEEEVERSLQDSTSMASLSSLSSLASSSSEPSDGGSISSISSLGFSPTNFNFVGNEGGLEDEIQKSDGKRERGVEIAAEATKRTEEEQEQEEQEEQKQEQKLLLNAVLTIQARVRRMVARRQHCRLMQKNLDILIAAPGTIQGRDGWYEVYIPSDQCTRFMELRIGADGQWQKGNGPLTHAQWKAHRESP